MPLWQDIKAKGVIHAYNYEFICSRSGGDNGDIRMTDTERIVRDAERRAFEAGFKACVDGENLEIACDWYVSHDGEG